MPADSSLPAEPLLPPVSPCVRMCTLDDDRICVGCGRHLDEIIAWTRMNPEQQQAVCDVSARRRASRFAGSAALPTGSKAI